MPRGRQARPAKEIMINEEATIKMRNEVVNGKYHLPLLEMRMLMALAGHISKNSEGFECYSIPVKELAEFMMLNETTQYTVIRKLARNLRRRELFFEWFARPDSKKKSWLTTGWFDYIMYDDETMSIEYQFASKIEPMLLQVQKAYIQLQCKPLMAFKCMYSNRLLMLIMEWENIQPRKISIDELRDMFQLTEKYKLYADFKRFVMEPAIKEINAMSDFTVRVTPLKTGKSYTHYKFYIKRKVKATIDIKPMDTDVELPSEWQDWQREAYKLLTSDQNGLADDEFLIQYISKTEKDLLDANIEYAMQQRAEGKVRKWPAYLRMALQGNYGFNYLISKREQQLEEEKRRNALLVDPLTGELTREGKLAEQTAAFNAEQEKFRKDNEDVEPMSTDEALEKLHGLMKMLNERK